MYGLLPLPGTPEHNSMLQNFLKTLTGLKLVRGKFTEEVTLHYLGWLYEQATHCMYPKGRGFGKKWPTVEEHTERFVYNPEFKEYYINKGIWVMGGWAMWVGLDESTPYYLVLDKMIEDGLIS